MVFTPVLADGFHWSLNDRKSPQVSRTLLSIVADPNNTEFWMVSMNLFSKSCSAFTNIRGLFEMHQFLIGINVTIMIHRSF